MSVSGSSHRFDQCLLLRTLGPFAFSSSGFSYMAGLARSLLAQRLLGRGLSRENPVDDLRHFVEIVVCINRMSI